MSFNLFTRKYGSILTMLCIGFLAASIVVILSYSWLVERYELKTDDYLYRFKLDKERISDDIIIIEIDDTTVKRLGWPLPREYYAILLRLLKLSGAKVIAFDTVFSDPSLSPDGDRALVEETKKSKDVIHAAIFGEARSPFTEEGSMSLEKFSLSQENLALPELNRVLLPMPELLESAKKLGDISIDPDEDGTIRRLPLVRKYNGRLYPSLSLTAVLAFLNINNENVSILPGQQIVLAGENVDTISIPIDRRGRMLVNYASLGSYNQVEYSFLWLLQKFQQVSEGKMPEDMPDFRDKLVILGKVITGDSDQRPTPFAASFPMTRVHANVISNILQQNFLRQTPGYLGPMLSILFGIFIAFMTYCLKPMFSVLISFLVLILYILSLYLLFVHQNLLFPFLQPCLAILAGISSATFYRYIFDKKRMILALDSLSRYNESIIENIGDALVVVDIAGNITKFNKRAEEMLTVKKEVAGKTCQEVFSGDDQPLAELILKSLEEKNAFTNKEIYLKNVDKTRSLEINTSFVRDETGGIAGIVVLIRDVSELRQLQQQMQLRERLSAIGELAAEVGHEIKNLLQGIRLYAEHLMEDLSPDDLRREYAEGILTETDNLRVEVNQLNDYAKPLSLNLVKGNVNEIVESAMLFAVDDIKKNHIEVIKRFQEDIPEIPVDEMYLRQALVNLINNAVHAMPAGGNLTIETRRRNESIELLVKDTGTGIPESIRSRIFDPYFTTKKGIGTGLGLSIAHKNVVAHGGTIQLIETEIGIGSAFVIKLPIGGKDNEQIPGSG